MKLAGPLVISAMLLAGANAVAQTYTVVDLATLEQGSSVVVNGPNSTGTAVGGGKLAGTGNPRSGLLFQNPPAVRQITGLPGSDYATVFGLNDAGGFVGSSNTATAARAFAGTLTGALRELPPLAGHTASFAYAVNNLNQAVGFSSGAAGERAVIWDTNGIPTALPLAPGVTSSRATGVNERGDIAGVIGTAADARAVLWPGGQVANQLLPLAGHAISEAFDINARGDVVGYSGNASGSRRATLWPSNGAGVDLGTLPGGDFSQAFGNNDAGDIVGTSTSTAGDRAVRWTSSGLQDLNSLIPPSPFVLTNAVGINNAGMIIATGHDVAAGHAHDDTHELPIRVFLLIRSGASR